MQANNSLAPRQGQAPATFSNFITGEGVRRKINEMVGGKDGQRFITSIISAVSNNPALAECDHGTILSAAMLGESLKLSSSAQLGQFYMVPFKDKKNNRTVATFVLGYKGYIQLAIRSGQYKKLNVLAIKEGELVSYDPLNEEIEVNLIQDDAAREEAPTIGYYAMFEYVNGFRKTMYWSRERMEAHADKYSAAFSLQKYHDLPAGGVEALPYNERWKYSSFWYKDFDGMAYKTMLRQIISKWGIMSVELQKAMDGDSAMIVNGEPQYIESEPIPQSQPAPQQEHQDNHAEQAADNAEDDFFSGAQNGGNQTQPQGNPDPEDCVDDEYSAMNAAERKAYLKRALEGLGVTLTMQEKFLGKGFAQWAKKDRIALIDAIQQVSNGGDPAMIFRQAA